MAEIYKAQLLGMSGFEKILVIKRILPHFSENEEFVTMFIDEAKIAGQLTHANIVQIFDLGKIKEDYFIAMEYIHGKDLRNVIKRAIKLEHKISVEHSVYIMREVLKGLDFAHRKKDSNNRPLNIIHRDISPQNILVSYEGEAKLTDFGIAKATTKASETQAGVLKGKFAYMSPEQASGKKLTQQSDVFAIGIILWETLTAQRLFLAKTDFATLELVREANIPPPSKINKDVPKALDRIVLRALQKKLEKRYMDANEFCEDLNKFIYSSSTLDHSKLSLVPLMQTLFAPEIKKDEEDRNEEASALMEFKEHGSKRGELPSFDSESTSPEQYFQTPETSGHESSAAYEDSGKTIEDSYDNDAEEEMTPPRRQGSFLVKAGVSIAVSLLLAVLYFGGMYAFDWYNQYATLNLNSNPPDAMVYLNKKQIGKTPIKEFQINTKEINIINVVLDGYQPASFLISVPKKGNVEKTVSLDLTSRGEILIESEPDGAEIWVDNKKVEQKNTPDTISLAPGKSYEIMVKKNGYKSYEKTIRIEANSKDSITATLVKSSKRLKIESTPEDVTVTVNGEPAEKPTPTTIQVSPDEMNTLILEKPGYKRLEVKLKPEDVATQNVLNYTLEKQTLEYGKLSINGKGWADIYIDKQKIKTTPMVDYQIGVGSHEVRLFNPKLKKEKIYPIAIVKDQHERLFFDFSKP
jgi:serine/threonine protein kinase